MRHYLKSLERFFTPSLISGLTVAVPGYVLTFTVLPQYIRFIEPKPLTHSLLLGVCTLLQVDYSREIHANEYLCIHLFITTTFPPV
jgi:hypothetical protein